MRILFALACSAFVLSASHVSARPTRERSARSYEQEVICPCDGTLEYSYTNAMGVHPKQVKKAIEAIYDWCDEEGCIFLGVIFFQLNEDSLFMEAVIWEF